MTTHVDPSPVTRAQPTAPDGASGAAVVARDVVKAVRAGRDMTEILHGVSLVVEYGEMVAVMGPSGSGKVDLLYCLAGTTARRDRLLRQGSRVAGMVVGVQVNYAPDQVGDLTKPFGATGTVEYVDSEGVARSVRRFIWRHEDVFASRDRGFAWVLFEPGGTRRRKLVFVSFRDYPPPAMLRLVEAVLARLEVAGIPLRTRGGVREGATGPRSTAGDPMRPMLSMLDCKASFTVQ
ncbi:MAG: hypothetical protein QM619_05305 [Micropruina sp.]|uniref:ATP-binding cassette domain-containing protein n=1 Tax=Micropruina sp. TaxID=2737536 RepID=UPI0039E4A497